MHNGLMRIRSQAQKIKDKVDAGEDGGLQKMSKSLGNEIVVSEVFKKHEPETLRLLLLATHYRSPIEYSEDRLAELRRSLDSFYRFFERHHRVTGSDFYELSAPRRGGQFEVGTSSFLADIGRLRAAFLDSMADDFNTGGAVGVLFELLTTLNRFADTQKLEEPGRAGPERAEFERGALVLRELSAILGLFQSPVALAKGGNDQLVGGLVQLLIDLRAEARKSKNFALGDQIRQRLTELGVTLEDRSGGTGWRIN
jgi:cysteinyl-tRNA synthetase